MVPVPGATSLAGIAVGQVVVWQVTALVAAALVLRTDGGARIAGSLAAALLVIAVVGLSAVRVKGRWLFRWAPVYLRSHLAGRQSRAAAGTVPPAAPDQAPPQPVVQLSLLTRLLPGVEVVEVTDRAGVRHGLVKDGAEWAAVLSLPTGQYVVDLADGQDGPRIPWSVLGGALDDRGVRLRAVQVVRLAVPTVPSGLDSVSPVAQSYAALAGPLPPRQRVFVALRLDPADCPAAVAARGGGDEGACRALISAVARLRYGLSQKGIRAQPMTEEQVWFAARTVLGATGEDPHDAAGSDPRQWRAWYADGQCHVAFTVSRWPAGDNPTALLADLAMVPAASCVTSLTVVPRPHGAPGMTATVRYQCRPADLDLLRASVVAMCRSRGATALPADGEHRRAVLLGLPLAAASAR